MNREHLTYMVKTPCCCW